MDTGITIAQMQATERITRSCSTVATRCPTPGRPGNLLAFTGAPAWWTIPNFNGATRSGGRLRSLPRSFTSFTSAHLLRRERSIALLPGSNI